MLPDFLLNFTDYFQPLNLFKYITFRTIGSLLTALISSSIIFDPKIKLIIKAVKRAPIVLNVIYLNKFKGWK